MGPHRREKIGQVVKTPEVPDGLWPNSYVINSEVVLGVNDNPERGTLSDVQYPSDTPLFGDSENERNGELDWYEHRVTPGSEPETIGGMAADWNSGKWCKHVQGGSPTSRLHPWHNGGANFGYVDGHAKWRREVPRRYQWMPHRPPGFNKA
jgi:prepilin-type processing-associated H-X9-DG protein